MPLEIFDYRTDIRNLLVTPHIRSRFLRMEPGRRLNICTILATTPLPPTSAM